MNIIYNSAYGRFEAQFSTDFNGDLAAVKGAGFKCDGPPSWIWSTTKLASLNKLRENRPISGLTINESAFQQYKILSEMEAKNEAARAAFAPVKEKQKKAKKQRKREEQVASVYHDLVIPHKPGELFDFIGKEDLPPSPEYASSFPEGYVGTAQFVNQWTGPRCVDCNDPVYEEYEQIEPVPICLWCSKMQDKKKVLDRSPCGVIGCLGN